MAICHLGKNGSSKFLKNRNFKVCYCHFLIYPFAAGDLPPTPAPKSQSTFLCFFALSMVKASPQIILESQIIIVRKMSPPVCRQIDLIVKRHPWGAFVLTLVEPYSA